MDPRDDRPGPDIGEETFCSRCYRRVDPDTHRCGGGDWYDDEDEEADDE